MPIDPTTRFTSRVKDYVQYRPGYPAAIYPYLRRAGALRPDDVIADIGSGTGILTQMFLDEAHTVIGIEPNAEMRKAGETLLRRYDRFRSVDARAEQTTLEENSVDAIVSGQAFHWFDIEPSAREFRRILRPDRSLVLIWNERHADASPFLQAYEKLLIESCPEYQRVDHRRVDLDAIQRTFDMPEMHTAAFENVQHVNLDAFIGRVLSSSYAPDRNDPAHEPFIARLTQFFHDHSPHGRVAFEYVTRVYHGVPGSAGKSAGVDPS